MARYASAMVFPEQGGSAAALEWRTGRRHGPVYRFAADAMLGRLARYLRILGYDTVWRPDRAIREVAARCADDRVLISANRTLGDQAPWLEILMVPPSDPVDQLATVIRRLDLRPGARLFSRCIRCNRLLAPLAVEEARLRVVPAVARRHRSFYTCPACGYVFWHGSHVRNTLRKLAPVLPADSVPVRMDTFTGGADR